ncbi:MAG: anti-sigma factor family protein [Burkholderiales bacterium]
MTDKRILTCEEALRFLAAYLDGELDDATDRDLESHLARCRACYSRVDFEKRLKQHVGTLGRSEVRPEFVERIHKLLSGFTPSPGAPE